MTEFVRSTVVLSGVGEPDLYSLVGLRCDGCHRLLRGGFVRDGTGLYCASCGPKEAKA